MGELRETEAVAWKKGMKFFSKYSLILLIFSCVHSFLEPPSSNIDSDSAFIVITADKVRPIL